MSATPVRRRVTTAAVRTACIAASAIAASAAIAVSPIAPTAAPTLDLLVAAQPRPAPAPGPQPAQRYRPPVDAPVVDGFRPPETPYGPGNRGLDYGTVPGTTVRAVGDGVVTFAGPIAGAWYVTVLHPDGLRSSLSFLTAALVERGERVRRGQPVGVASSRIQIGFRDPDDRYLDPATLLERLAARLVPPPTAR